MQRSWLSVAVLASSVLAPACGADPGDPAAVGGQASGAAAGMVSAGGASGASALGGGAGTSVASGGVGGMPVNAGGGGASAGSGGGGSGGVSGASAGSSGSGGAGSNPSWCEVGTVPDDLRKAWDVDPYYQKYADANGIPILNSMRAPDNAIILACELVLEMVGKRDDVRLALIKNKVHFTVIGEDENTNDVPEYAYLPDSINERARGLGGVPGMCAEESILCGASDRWRGESICVHEFAHTISLYGMYTADPSFEDRLIDAFEKAKATGHFANTYAMENEQEYWGEIVQDWYYTNLESNPANGVHNSIDTREELLEVDPGGYALVKELLSEDVSWDDCYRDD